MQDLGSTNGTFIGQRAKKIVKSEATRVKVNSILTVGDIKVKLRCPNFNLCLAYIVCFILVDLFSYLF